MIRTRPLPYPEADLMHTWQLLGESERERLEGIRAFLQNRVRPESVGYWNREEFPHHLLPEMAAFGLGSLQIDGSSDLFKGLVYVEAARADVSLSALVGIHNELIVGMIHEFGWDRRRQGGFPGSGISRHSAPSPSPSPATARTSPADCRPPQRARAGNG